MQQTSETWKELWASGEALVETKAIINGVEYTAISVPQIMRATIQNSMYVGNCISSSCMFSLRPNGTIPKSAEVQLKMRLVSMPVDDADDEQEQVVSEWRPAGTYYISKRVYDHISGILSLECYDALMKGNAAMLDSVPWTTETGEAITTGDGEIIFFSARQSSSMLDVARDIALIIGVVLDPRSDIDDGEEYYFSTMPENATINDVLSIIAAVNCGNWVITPENKLRLVAFKSSDGAEDATEDVVVVNNTVGGIYVGETVTITGVRNDDGGNEPVLIGDESGVVVETALADAYALLLADKIIGVNYQPYEMRSAIYDPAAEIGDYIRGGATGVVSSVLYNENVTLGNVSNGDVIAPDPAELADEFPYVGGNKRTLKLARVYAQDIVEQLDSSLDTAGVFNRLTNNGAIEGLYMLDGQLYVNASYIKSGTMMADLIKGGTLVLGGDNDINGKLQVLDANNDLVGTWDNTGIELEKGSLQIDVNGENVCLNKPLFAAADYQPRYVPFHVSNNAYYTEVHGSGISVTNGTARFTTAYAQVNANSISVRGAATNDVVKMGVGGIYTDCYLYLSTSHHARWFWVNGYFEKEDPDNPGIVIIGEENPGVSISTFANINELNAGSANITGDLTVGGTKSRIVSTDQYSDRILYCYETPSPMFGDVGEGTISEDGLCYVTIDPVFAQTITADNYQVFLQRYGKGDCYVRERRSGWFVVVGTPGISFGWEIKAKQHDFDQRRLERVKTKTFTVPQNYYGEDAATYINQLKKERELIYEENN